LTHVKYFCYDPQIMPLYIRLPVSDENVTELWGQAETVELRAHATEVVCSDAAYLKAMAAEKWPKFSWRIEPARTARYIVKGHARATAVRAAHGGT
jgi:hypothetical protein